MKSVCTLGLVAALVSAFAGCRSAEPEDTNYEAALPPGQSALRKITDPRLIPDFTVACTDTAGLRESTANSLNYLKKPSSQKVFPVSQINHAQVVASLEAFLKILDSRVSPSEMNAAIRSQFDVYTSVGCDNKGTVLFTGYYTPVFEASPVRTEKFKYPLYKPPQGLVKLPDGNPATPMPDRRTIESSGMYAGNELVWMADPFEAFVAHIQGSATLRMPDGHDITVGYAANNGHEYRSIRAELVKDGKIAKRAGLPLMIGYFRSRAAEITAYTWRNPRFIFFTLVADGRPRGCINEPVIERRTIATDKKIFPSASLVFISAKLPQRSPDGTIADAPYHAFALDQDAGGAIRAPGRCDLYMGVGPQAGQLAGRAQNEGRLYYLFLKGPGASGL